MSVEEILVANERAGSTQVLIDHGRRGSPFHEANVLSLERILRLLNADTQQ